MKSNRLKKMIIIILGLKFILITSIILVQNKVISIGEKPTFAENIQTKKSDSEESPTISNSEFLANLNEQEIKNHELMKDLLNMPDINTAKLEKDNMDDFINLLNQKKETVEERLQLLARKIATYENLEKNLEERIKKIQEETQFFTQTLQRERKIKDERLKKLIKLYEKMEPKRAAPVFENMDKDLVVALFKDIRQKQITAILENMNADKATELTEYYGRIRSTSEYEVLKEMNKSLKDAFQECKS